MTTLAEVYSITMSLIDELNERTGEAESPETRDYKQRTIGITTALLGEIYPYSDTFRFTDKRHRPVCPTVSDFGDEIPLDDFLARSVLPCALAARLLLDENPAVASYYERRYMELLVRYGSVTSSEPIANLYGKLDAESDFDCEATQCL